jgi:hypothetical protein
MFLLILLIIAAIFKIFNIYINITDSRVELVCYSNKNSNLESELYKVQKYDEFYIINTNPDEYIIVNTLNNRMEKIKYLGNFSLYETIPIQ